MAKYENVKAALTISREKLADIYRNTSWEEVKKGLEACGLELTGKEEKRWRKGWEDWRRRHPPHKGVYEPPPGEPPELIRIYREKAVGCRLSELVSIYFQFLEKINDTRLSDEERLKYCRLSFPLIEPLIRNSIEEYGWFDIQHIPAFEFPIEKLDPSGIKYELAVIKMLVNYFPQLAPWKKMLKKATT